MTIFKKTEQFLIKELTNLYYDNNKLYENIHAKILNCNINIFNSVYEEFIEDSLLCNTGISSDEERVSLNSNHLTNIAFKYSCLIKEENITSNDLHLMINDLFKSISIYGNTKNNIYYFEALSDTIHNRSNDLLCNLFLLGSIFNNEIKNSILNNIIGEKDGNN